ncbi:unnamed protein product [Cyclocybe aegerita]|uniref:NACHT domain-containing protein n=1 Tax=Cyclocybe aegerita TaxID=1973307 RepID=A0A8S0XZN5_CYCAE|nr:unnamed protein product [Cyclocybe aegerita]
MDWIVSVDDKSGSMLVLHGSGGAGKSALEQSISERCQRVGYLGAAFFLSRTAVFPWLRYLVLREIEDDPRIFQLSRAGIMHHFPESHLTATLNKEISSIRRSRTRLLDLEKDKSVDIDMHMFLVNEFRHIRETHPARQALPDSWPTDFAASTDLRTNSNYTARSAEVETAEPVVWASSPDGRGAASLQVLIIPV